MWRNDHNWFTLIRVFVNLYSLEPPEYKMFMIVRYVNNLCATMTNTKHS